VARASASESRVVPWAEVHRHEKLGEGAFGEVFAAEYARTRCALKQLSHPAGGTDMGLRVEHLKAEFDMMLMLRHPHVLQMIGFASDGVEHCGILMELMEANLNDILYKPAFAEYNTWQGALLSVATDACLGMSYLHQQAVLHCDLKPANVLISAQWVAKVADFGHSNEVAAPDALGRLEQLKGTPPYMAPEVISKRAYDKPCDVWSFGCLLVHMACGQPPYAGAGCQSVRDVFTVVVKGKVAPDTNVLEQATPAAIVTLLRACVARDSSKRPTFEAIADTLSSARTIHSILRPGGKPGEASDSDSTDRTDPRPIGRLRKGVPTTAKVQWDVVKGAVHKGRHLADVSYGTNQFTAQFRARGATGGADSLPAADPLASMGTFFKSLGSSFFGEMSEMQAAADQAAAAAHSVVSATAPSTIAAVGSPPDDAPTIGATLTSTLGASCDLPAPSTATYSESRVKI